MKKHLILTSLAAIVATGAAYADEISTNVNFDGKYTLHEAEHSVKDNVSTLYPADNYDYEYTGYIYNSETGTYKSETMPTNLADNVNADHFKYTSYNDATGVYTVNQTYESGKEDKFQTTKNWLATTDNENKGMVSVTDQVLNGNDDGSLGTFKYTYNGHTSTLAVDEEGNFVAMDTTNLSGNVDLAGASVAGLTLETPESVSVTATSGTESTVSGLSADSYVYETANGSRYVLNATGGTASYDSVSGEYSYTGTITMTNPDGFPEEIPENPVTDAEKAAAAAYNALKAAFVQDTYNTQQKVAELQTTYAEEEKAYAAAKLAYTNDEAILNNLSDAYTTYTNAGTAYANATAADLVSKVEAERDQSADIAYHNAANKYYNAPIETTISDAVAIETTRATEAESGLSTAIANETSRATEAESGLSTAIANETSRATEAESGLSTAIANETSRATEAESGLSTAIANETARATEAESGLSTAIANETSRATEAESGLSTAIANEKTARENADIATLNSANSYTDSALDSAKAFANAGDAWTLKQANAYTNKKVDALEKNVSGGVAAATALSAVSVGNVERGEVSVGGGYGYFNGQSAMAFGGAMGLSDRWSVNAGAGIAQGDKTQFSIRAGTNYKFKLF